jgi:hypothetical protein
VLDFFFLLYRYKGTNTDAAGAELQGRLEALHPLLPQVLLLLIPYEAAANTLRGCC